MSSIKIAYVKIRFLTNRHIVLLIRKIIYNYILDFHTWWGMISWKYKKFASNWFHQGWSLELTTTNNKLKRLRNLFPIVSKPILEYNCNRIFTSWKAYVQVYIWELRHIILNITVKRIHVRVITSNFAGSSQNWTVQLQELYIRSCVFKGNREKPIL